MHSSDLDPKIHRWTRDQYERLVANGVLAPESRVELVAGIVYDKKPQTSRRAAVIGRINKILAALITEDCSVRVQAPLALGGDSLPEPDLAVVPGDDFHYLDAHPTTALPLVEVADSSAHRDREIKVGLYARSGIPEYWIVSVSEKTLEIFRKPLQDGYCSKAVLGPSDSVAPLSQPQVTLAVGHFLP